MSDFETAGRILLLGDSHSDTLWLLEAIRGQGDAIKPQECYEWRLDTKYYAADVQIDVRHVEQCSQLQLGSAGYEAVLMVFDASEKATFESVQRWYQAAGGSEAELGVRLAVGVYDSDRQSAASDEQGKSRWLVAAEDWCAEQLVEFVEAYRGEQHGQQPAASREDAAGVQRVREALEAHMWPGLQLKPNPRHGQGLAARAARAAAGSEQAADAMPGPGLLGTSAANGHANRTSGGPAEGVDLSFADYLRAPDEVVAAGGLTGSAVNEEEAGVEQLERLFDQVASE